MDYALFYAQKGLPRNPTQEVLVHKVPHILLNKPLSTILWREGSTHPVWRFTQVYDIVNESVYQDYSISEFGIQKSEFRIRNSEFETRHSEFRIRNSVLRIIIDIQKLLPLVYRPYLTV